MTVWETIEDAWNWIAHNDYSIHFTLVALAGVIVYFIVQALFGSP